MIYFKDYDGSLDSRFHHDFPPLVKCFIFIFWIATEPSFYSTILASTMCFPLSSITFFICIEEVEVNIFCKNFKKGAKHQMCLNPLLFRLTNPNVIGVIAWMN